jgi:hypothetical protein
MNFPPNSRVADCNLSGYRLARLTRILPLSVRVVQQFVDLRAEAELPVHGSVVVA